MAKPRLFFNLIRRRQCLLDHEGLEVASVDDAIPGVIRAIKELREERKDELDLAGWTLDVVDHSGRLRASLALTDSPRRPRSRHSEWPRRSS